MGELLGFLQVLFIVPLQEHDDVEVSISNMTHYVIWKSDEIWHSMTKINLLSMNIQRNIKHTKKKIFFKLILLFLKILQLYLKIFLTCLGSPFNLHEASVWCHSLQALSPACNSLVFGCNLTTHYHLPTLPLPNTHTYYPYIHMIEVPHRHSSSIIISSMSDGRYLDHLSNSLHYRIPKIMWPHG